MRIEGLESKWSVEVKADTEADFEAKMHALVGPEWHHELPKIWKPGSSIKLIGIVQAVEIIVPGEKHDQA